MEIVIPEEQAEQFRTYIATETFRRDERGYKDAVHLVMAALLSPQRLAGPDFPARAKDVFSAPVPDLAALGLPPEDQERVKAADPTRVREAMANLSGGRWGLAQFYPWMSRAIEHGLAEEIREAFARLIDSSIPLPGRVDAFRDDLYVVAQELERRGGFESNWRLFRVSLSFVAMVLGAYDPNRYTFYAAGPLERAVKHYLGAGAWPAGTAGERYEQICVFVTAVADALRARGVPIADLIDAQTFIWVNFEHPAPAPAPAPVAGAEETPPAPAGWPLKLALANPATRMEYAKELASAVNWPVDRALSLIEMAGTWRQLLFEGPPGTGKTFVAKHLTRVLTAGDEERLDVVQFHPSYAYEDFMEGIRPRVTADAGLAYELRRGRFLRLCDQARAYPEQQFFIIIDEINRANLPRVFGELLYGLEYRGAANGFALTYSGDNTYIPENVTLIATMNSADRSIALVDAAVRRRFRHVPFEPDPEALRGWLTDHWQGAIADLAVQRLIDLNAKLAELLDPERLIGHSYLMRADLDTVGLTAVWEEDIEPVLREHLFRQPEEVAGLRKVFLGEAASA